jgi:chromosome segregation ATPase
MDKESLQRQLEDMEEASERWRAERRRLNGEIDKLEAALAEAKADAARKQNIAQKSQAADSRTLARVQEAAEQKLKKAAEDWDAERAKLTSKINRLEGALTEAIARASNPLRITQSVKEQFELELDRVAKEKTEIEQAFLRAKTEWEQEKLKMTGEMVKLRRTAQIMGRPVPTGKTPEINPKVRDLEDQLHQKLQEWSAERAGLTEKIQKLADASRQWDSERRQLGDHAGQLQQALTQAQATIQTYELAARKPHPAEQQLEELKSEVETLRAEAVRAREAAEIERQQLTSRLAEFETELQQRPQQTAGSEDEKQALTSRIEQLEQQLQKAAETGEHASNDLRSAWENERRHLASRIGELERELRDVTEKREHVQNDIINQLRRQYEQRLQEAIAQRAQMAGEMQNARNVVEGERPAGSRDTAAIEGEIARVEGQLHEIVALIENPDTELSTVIKKNVEKAELEAYLKGILFSAGK